MNGNEASLDSFPFSLTRTAKTDDTLGRLVERARRGDLAAFESIVRRYEAQVLRIARRVLGNTTDAEDAAQDVFLKLHRSLDRFDTSREFSPWLIRLTVNVCTDALRRRRQSVPLEEIHEPAAGMSPELEFRDAERKRLLDDAIQLLPEKQRLALVLRDIEELPVSEVAAALGIEEATVRSHIAAARLKLRTVLRDLR